MAGAISLFGNVLFGLPSRANQINYDNTNSGLSATQVQAAIDELNGDLTSITIQSKAQFEELCFNADSQTKAIWFMTESTFSIFPITNGSGIILPCPDLTWRKVIYHGGGNTLFIGEINKSNNVLTYTWKQVTTTGV